MGMGGIARTNATATVEMLPELLAFRSSYEADAAARHCSLPARRPGATGACFLARASVEPPRR